MRTAQKKEERRSALAAFLGRGDFAELLTGFGESLTRRGGGTSLTSPPTLIESHQL